MQQRYGIKQNTKYSEAFYRSVQFNNYNDYSLLNQCFIQVCVADDFKEIIKYFT
jgi:hypothetical protein